MQKGDNSDKFKATTETITGCTDSKQLPNKDGEVGLSLRKENKGDNSKNLRLREVNRIQNYINGTNAERKPILTMLYGLPTFCFSLSLFLPQGQQTFHKKRQ